MKKWKLWIVMGMLALAVVGCKGGASDGAETTPAQTQEADVQGGASEEEKDSAGEKGEEASSKEEVSAANAEEIAASNPMQEVSGTEAFAEIGVSMEMPESVELGQCFIISQVVAEVNFTQGNHPYIYRGSATAEDFAGIFEEFEEEVTRIAATEEMEVDGELTIKTTKSGGRLAGWSKGGANYTLYTPASVEEEELLSLCRELIAKN